MSGVRLYGIRSRGGRDYELTRRRFLELVAASAAVSWAPGCSQNPSEKILPYTRQPVDVIPGVPSAYATSFAIDGYAMGLIAQTREGRPVKVDGHPEHPTSLGATSAFHQASVLQLYDPDRASAVLQRAQPSSWPNVLAVLQQVTGRGEGLRLLLEPTSSPLVHALLAEVKQRYPASRVSFFAPLRSEADTQASQVLFGRALSPQYDLSQADCIVSLDSDLLATPYDLRHARAFAARRAPLRASDEMTRLYAIEAALSVTGGMADHRLARPSRRVAQLTAALAGAVTPRASAAAKSLDAAEQHFVEAIARDLRARPSGHSLIVPGLRQPAEVHVLAHGMNAALGNLGRTVHFSEPAVPAGEGDQSFAALVAEMRSGKVESLVILGGNPAYFAAADLEWERAVRAVPQSVYLGAYYNETASSSRWFAPEAHSYEQWSDGRAYDGTLSIAQPLIRPMHDGKSITELLAVLAQRPAVGDFARLRARFGAEHGEHLDLTRSEPERAKQEDPAVRVRWEEAIATGFVRDSAFAASPVTPREGVVEHATAVLAKLMPEAGLELNLLPSPTLHDGRFANVSWLLELPEPITKLTWDNAALVSPATAARLGIGPTAEANAEVQPMLEIAREGHVLRIPVLVEPHHAPDSVSVWLGYGRQGRERLARGVGANAYELRTSAAPWFGPTQLTLLVERYPLAITQREHDQHGRNLALVASLSEFRAQPELTPDHKAPLPTLLSDTTGSGPQWAMTIDLSACTGCSACMVACQAENNVLVVGKAQVRRGREMHWLRIDSYASGRGEGVVHQPMLCQHCEKAPCEYVCPVNATVHSPDGLNEMVYNRCVGTRFCSNNCPYKVRRFNWFDWTEEESANRGRVELQRNPEVTVRERGVMEKCTYCVQRVRGAEMTARKERRAIRVGEVVTACQQACPSRAISFGSLHEHSPMIEARRSGRSYAALRETNAQPRTLYLARIENPNPELVS